MKKYFPILLLILLLALSLYSATPVFSSSELKQVTEGNVTTFVDKDGNVKMAADKGYASVERVYEDGKVVLERYLDEDGDPVILSAGYSQVKRVYSEQGIEINYLDENGLPVVINNGYDTIRRSYNSAGKADTDTYYADETVRKPLRTSKGRSPGNVSVPERKITSHLNIRKRTLTTE